LLVKILYAKTETERILRIVRVPGASRGFRLRAGERRARRMKIEMNIRPSFERHGCRIVVAVTGKRGHRVYASRGTTSQKSRGCPSFVSRGSLHPTTASRCRIGCIGGYVRRLWNEAGGNKEEGGGEGFDFAIARASGNPRLIVFTVRQRQAARVEI